MSVFSTGIFAQSRFDEHLIDVLVENDTTFMTFVKTPELFEDQWDTLAQPNFWKFVMSMPPDSTILNIARTREILEIKPYSEWDAQTDEEKEAYRNTLRKKFNLDSTERIYSTTGKNDFYHFEKVFPSISRGIELFTEYDTDPWYAQAILMIESPGKIAYSNVGALGPFQLMKKVARNHGLRVDKYVDERKDFDKSAYGASHLLRTGCIPEAKRIMRKFGVHVEGDDEYSLWFRLTVLHIYHAGAGNVENVLTHVVKPTTGGKPLITEIWHSEYGNFKNASQNYSQLALAALIVLNDFIVDKAVCVYDCKLPEPEIIKAEKLEPKIEK